ncbi:hypothetical protein MMC12_003577 [Toensbergia leucococca]|nr:hypothetical protein [Toensbergia leucococca]
MHTCIFFVLFCAIVCCVRLAASSPVNDTLQPRAAPVKRKFTRYVALGDSYSAGPGWETGSAVSSIGPLGEDCYRRHGAWPIQLKNSIGQDWDFQFSACSGLNTTEIRNEQILARNSQYGKPDLVSLTSGGNDGDSFAKVVLDCNSHLVGNCGNAIDNAHALAYDPEMANNIDATVIAAAKTNPVPGRVIMLVGYPRLYNQDTVFGFHMHCWLMRFRRRQINALVTQINTVLAAVAARHSHASGYTVIFVDPNIHAPGDLSFDGHRFCEKRSEGLWFQDRVNRSPKDTEDFWIGLFHPDLNGHAAIAQAAQNGLAALPA